MPALFLPTPVFDIVFPVVVSTFLSLVVLRCSWISACCIAIGIVAFRLVSWFAHYRHLNNRDGLPPPPPGSAATAVTFFAHGTWPANQALGYFFSADDRVTIVDGHMSFTGALLWLGSRIVRLPVFPHIMGIRTSGHSLDAVGDAYVYADAIVTYCRRTAETPIFLVGHSRGAATVFNALTILKLRVEWDTEIRHRIKHVIILCPLSTVDDVVQYRLRGIPVLVRAAKAILHRFTAHDVYGGEAWAPLHRVKQFPANVPLQLVWSKGDEHVPASSAQRLHAALEQHMAPGFLNALVLEDASHELPFALGRDHKALADCLLRIVTLS